MAKGTSGRLVIDDLTGGRNGYDPPWALANNQCVEADNIEFFKSKLGRKIGGAQPIAITFSAGGPFAAPIGFMFRHVPGIDDTAAELWAYDGTIWGRMAAATTFAAPTFKDASTATFATDVSGASINSHLMLAYKSAVARMHVWDGSTVRRSGLAATGAPTAADGGGGGAYAAVLRYYRQRSTRQSGGITIGRSEPSASVAFTPSGANLNATVTQATVINEGETHWEVEASIDNITFYRIATVVIATTTYADTALTTTYNTNPLSAATGTYTLQKPYKFIAADQNRVLGSGSYTTTDKQSRVEISAVIGSLDVADEERVDTTTNYFLDFDESDSGAITGLGGPILGSFFVFKWKQVWRLTPTGNTSQPFRADAISKTIGAVTHRSIVKGEDKDGNPALYWMSHRGPYRWSVNGLEYLGRNVEDILINIGSFITDTQLAHSLYHNDKRQVWFWVTTGFVTLGGKNIYAYKLVVFDVVNECWTTISSGAGAGAYASVMFSLTIAAAMSTKLKPYFALMQVDGSFNWVVEINIADNGTTITTGGNASTFFANVTTKAYEVGGPGYFGAVRDAQVVADTSAGTTIECVVKPDFSGATSKSGTALLTPTAFSELVQSKRFEDTSLSGFQFYQWQVGDITAGTTKAWSLGRLVIPTEQHESLS